MFREWSGSLGSLKPSSGTGRSEPFHHVVRPLLVFLFFCFFSPKRQSLPRTCHSRRSDRKQQRPEPSNHAKQHYLMLTLENVLHFHTQCVILVLLYAWICISEVFCFNFYCVKIKRYNESVQKLSGVLNHVEECQEVSAPTSVSRLPPKPHRWAALKVAMLALIS